MIRRLSDNKEKADNGCFPCHDTVRTDTALRKDDVAMEERTAAGSIIVQVRLSKKLKDQVSEVFDDIGLDIPTAVRMFLKAVIREQKLPFKTALDTDVVTVEMPSKEAKQLIKELERHMREDGVRDAAIRQIEEAKARKKRSAKVSKPGLC